MDFKSGKVDIDTLTYEEKWCIYMKYRHEREAKDLVKQLCQKEEGIMHAENAVRKLSRSERKYWLWFLKTKAEMEDAAYIRMKEKEAREEERKERGGKRSSSNCTNYIESLFDGYISQTNN